MKAILLAAGTGSRIAEHTGGQPKSMMPVGDKPLILHTVELLQKNHMEISVITGYRHRALEEVLKGYNVKIYYNPFYAVTNSLGSLWHARDEFCGDELFIANADVYYTQDLLDRIIEAPFDNFLVSDFSRADEGDYFFYSENNILKKFGKELKREERNCEYVGMAVLKNKWMTKFHDRMCEMIEKGDYDLWWENVLYSFVGEENIYTIDTKGIFWAELDTIEDYRRVLDHLDM